MRRVSIIRRLPRILLAASLCAATLTVALPPPASSAAGPVTVSLTFNDSLSTQFRNARPVLRAHGVNGTFYVASNYMLSGDPKYMQFYNLDTLYREGDEIGGMGRDHQELTQTYSSDPDADLAYKQDQVCGDRAKLADLGYDPQSFAYPGGAWSSAAASIVSGCGYLVRPADGWSVAGRSGVRRAPPADQRLRAERPEHAGRRRHAERSGERRDRGGGPRRRLAPDRLQRRVHLRHGRLHDAA